jgi:hypothetical protein
LIEVSRSLIRSFRAVLKKMAVVAGLREPPAMVVFRSDRDGLHMQARNTHIAIEFSQPGNFAADQIAVPADALGDIEGRKDESVRFEIQGDNIVARWQDKAVPHVKQYKAIEKSRIPEMPAFPTRMEHQPVELLRALRDASEVAGTDTVRFAVTCIQLRGKGGQIASTDGKQLLAQSGFTFPWNDDILVPGSQVFGCRELHDQDSVSLGRSKDYVTLTVGAWTLQLAINKDGRFPAVDSILKATKGTPTTIQLDPADVEFLLTNLSSLPGASQNAPITIDGNGEVLVRSKENDQPVPTEVVLARSATQGRKVSIATDRSYLAQALRLGFGQISIFGVDSPVLCRDEKRQYIWQPLGKDVVLKASDRAIRLTSADAAPVTSPAKETTAKPVEDEAEPSCGNDATLAVPSQTVPTGGSEPTGIAAVLAEAEEIKDLLRQAYTRVHQLISGAKRYRKQAHVLQTSLKALKQLQQIET